MTAPAIASAPKPPPSEAATIVTEPANIRAIETLAKRGSVIELVAYVANQALRLLTNLILSRLLFPEAYGMTAIVTVFMVALGMLTDVGLRDSIIRHERGDDPAFLNTAWSIQVMRGVGLWLASCVIAYPVARLYHEPTLFPLIAVAGFANVIHGFSSTAVHTLARRVERGLLVSVELVAKVVAMVIMFVWAKIHPTVWALVGGGLFASLTESVGSHLLPVGYRNRFQWDKPAAESITSFGKWIFGSSAFTFLAGEGDRILLGRFLTMAALGVYSVAGLLTSAIGLAVNQLTSRVFYGVFSMVARESRSELGRHYYSARLKLDLLAMPALGAMMVIGPLAVGILYDHRYHDAGWMLQILSIRVALSCSLAPCAACLIALGSPRLQLYGNLGRFLIVWTGIPIGWYMAGIHGVVWATSFSELPMLAVLWMGFRREGVLRVRRELLAPVMVLAGALIAFGIKLAVAHWLPAVAAKGA